MVDTLPQCYLSSLRTGLEKMLKSKRKDTLQDLNCAPEHDLLKCNEGLIVRYISTHPHNWNLPVP